MGFFDWRRKKATPSAPPIPEPVRARDGISPLWSTLYPATRGQSSRPPPAQAAPEPGEIIPPPPAIPVALLAELSADLGPDGREVFMAEPIPPRAPASNAPSEPPPVLRRILTGPPLRFVPGMFDTPAVTVSRVRAITDAPPSPQPQPQPPQPAQAPSAPPSASIPREARPASDAPPASARPAVAARGLHGARTMMRIALEAGDWDSVLAIGHKLLDRDEDDQEARACVDTGATRLLADFSARLGDRERIVRRVAKDEWLASIAIDARARALLQRIDGVRTLEQVLTSSGLAPLAAMGLLLDMLAEGVIELVARDRAGRDGRG
jgi:hypothetical protein